MTPELRDQIKRLRELMPKTTTPDKRNYFLSDNATFDDLTFDTIARNAIGPLLDAVERLEEAEGLLRQARADLADLVSIDPLIYYTKLHARHKACVANIDAYFNRPGKETK